MGTGAVMERQPTMAINLNRRTYQNGKTYWVVSISLTYPDGQRARKRANRPGDWSRARVTKWARQREAFLIQQGPDRKEANKNRQTGQKIKTTFLEFVARFLVEYPQLRGLRASTVHRYRTHVARFFGPMFGTLEVDSIDSAAFRKLAALELAPGTRNVLIAELLCMMRVAHEWEVRSLPPPKVKRVREQESDPHWYSPREYAAMIAAAPTSQHELVVLLGGDAGLRSGEILALKVEDVDFTARELYIHRSMWRGEEGPTKGGKDRRVPISRRLHKVLREACAGASRKAYVLTGTNESLTRSQLKHRARVVEARALGCTARECPGRIHVYRHTFCSNLVRSGVHPRAVQKLAGHSSLRQTERYMSVSNQQLHNAIDMLDTLDLGAGADVTQPDSPDEKT